MFPLTIPALTSVFLQYSGLNRMFFVKKILGTQNCGWNDEGGDIPSPVSSSTTPLPLPLKSFIMNATLLSATQSTKVNKTLELKKLRNQDNQEKTR